MFVSEKKVKGSNTDRREEEEEEEEDIFSSKKKKEKISMLSSFIRRGRRRALGLSRSMRNASLSSSFRSRRLQREESDDNFSRKSKNRNNTMTRSFLREEREKNGVHRNVRVSNERRGQRSHRRRVNLARVRDHREQRENDFDDISSGSDFGEHVAIRDKAEERVKTRLRQFRSNTTKKSSFSTHQRRRRQSSGCWDAWANASKATC